MGFRARCCVASCLGVASIPVSWRGVGEPVDTSGGAPVQRPGQRQSGWLPGMGLTEIEEKMRAAAAAGEPVHGGEGPFGPTEMQAWGQERTVRAAVLRYLLINDKWPVDVRGVRLRGVRISGVLDLEAAVLRCPFSLEDCYLPDEPARLGQATASRIALTGCQVAGVLGDMLTARELDLSGSTLTGTVRLRGASIAGQLGCSGTTLAEHDGDGGALIADALQAGDVFLDRGFTAAGAVRLSGAQITGMLNCGGAQLDGCDGGGTALAADGLRAGEVFLGMGFTTAGAVRLSGAQITGVLNCGGAQLNGCDGGGTALAADGLRAGEVFLGMGFTAAGAVRLSGAQIAGKLICSGAQITRADQNGVALAGDGMRVSGVLLDSGWTAPGFGAFIAAGTVRLSGAEIAGALSCHDAQLTGALAADGLRASGVFLDGAFTAAGAVSLVSARVTGPVDVAPLRLAEDEMAVAFDASQASITGRLRWVPAEPVRGLVRLEDVTAREVEDDWSGERANGYWPAGGRLYLNGFVYGKFRGEHQAALAQRLSWIRSQYGVTGQGKRLGLFSVREWAGFSVQPYEQLASAYRQEGQDSQARQAAIASRIDRRTYGNLSPVGWTGNWLLDKTIKYGYQNWRAVTLLASAYAAVVVLAVIAQHHHVIVPVGTFKGNAPSATHCLSNYPCFYPAIYAVDVVIPVINVHQAAYWGINGHAGLGWAWVGVTSAATVFGWAAATFLIAGMSSLIRQR